VPAPPRCSFEISQYITKHFALDAAAQKAAGEPGHGLKVAGSTGERRQEDGIGIVLTTDKDEETVRRERDEEAAAKRQQNAMPAWHLKSTISGDLTALGIKENAQSATAQAANPGNLDESLKGLGRVVRPSSSKTQVIADAEGNAKPNVKESGNDADCKLHLLSRTPKRRWGSIPFTLTNHLPFFEKTLNKNPRASLRLRPILRIVGGFGCTLDTAHTLGRILRSG
jgi:hypothetical protein